MQHNPLDVSQFAVVDQTVNPTAFVRFMDESHAQQTTQRYKEALLEHLALTPGATVLDIGCGTGQDALDLARAVGATGQVIGIDSSETMLQAARTRAAQASLAVDFVEADATQLPFTDARFDACQASRVLGHLPDPALAIAEMVRVTRPGGRVVLADGDLDLIAIDIADRPLARKMIHAACDQLTHGWMGRQLPRLLKSAGVQGIWVEGRLMPLDYAAFQSAFRGLLQRAEEVAAVNSEELSRFWQALEEAEHAGHFFARVGGFIVSGRKPV